MYKSSKLNHILQLLVYIGSFISFIMLLLNQKDLYPGYEYIYLLPLSYIIMHTLFIRLTLKKYGLSMFIFIYIIVSFTRFCIWPLLTYITGWYFGYSNYMPMIDSFHDATFLMIYELLCYNIAIYIFHKVIIKQEVENEKNTQLNFQFNTDIYMLFVIFSIILILLRPNVINYISFVKVNSNFTSFTQIDTITSFVIVLLSLSRFIIYFLTIKYTVQLFQKKYPTVTFILVSFITIINSLIFFGTNRAEFIMTFIVSMVILTKLYGKLSLALNAIIIVFVPYIVGGITSFRKTTTITDGKNTLIDVTDYLQVYLAGLYNVAISLELPSRFGEINLMIVEIFRSAIGPNLLLKNVDMITSSQLFNYRIFQNGNISQIIPMIGQSKLYLGYIFAPLLGIFFIIFAIYLTKVITKTDRIDLKFILVLISGQLGFVMAQNASIFINEITFTLPLFLIIYYVNNKVGRKNE